MLVVFGTSVVVGAYLAFVGGWPIVALGLLSIAAGVAYTGGPYPLGYHGWGDLAVFLFFGLAAVCGSYWVQALALPVRVVAAAVPIGALATAILVVNNLRDIATDAAAGKRTLAVRLGRRGARIEYLLLVFVAYAACPVLWWVEAGSAWLWLPWASLPLAARLVTRVWREEGPSLNEVLTRTAQLELLFASLLAIGWLL
jgi:1,4-dihydroxy-2-naphthoate octaprenyltransferase